MTSSTRSFSVAAVSCALLLTSLATVANAQRRAVGTDLVAPANAQLLGRLPGSRRISLAIALPLRNQDRLNALLPQLYDPASPNYRRFLTVQQFTEQFGPTAADYQGVVSFAQEHGFNLTHTFANRLVIDVNGTVNNVESTFHVTMQAYQHPTENRTFYAPDVEPTVEDGLPVLSVVGLNTFSVPHPMLRKAPPEAGPHSKAHSDTTGSGPGGEFLGSDMRTAYGGGTSLDGAGQAVGLIELGPYRLSDVLSYFTSLGQPLNVPITNVLVGVNGVCGVGCDDGEEVIDIQQAISIAPNLSAMIVYETNGPNTDALSAYAQAASDNIAKQLSISFGWGDTPGSTTGQAYEQVFEELEAQGTSSFVASGDAGASLSGGYPGNSPNITDAGGTDLTTGAGQAWSSESGWIGSGGGWNVQSPIPATPTYAWNQGPAINSSNGGDPSYRNIPDVSAEANTDNYFCANGSCQGGIGGTSLAAPRWAAFVALINQQAAANAAAGANPTLGFLNPTIYTLNSGDYASDFHDITTGNDATSTTCMTGTLGCLPSGLEGFDAVTGFDLVTGWGSPNGPTVFDALFPASTNANFSMSASPATLSLAPGGHATTSISVSALHGFSAATNLTVVIPGAGIPSYAPAGLSANLSASSIGAGGSAVTLTVSTTSATPGGTYVIAVVGTSGNLTQTAYVTVELPAFVGLAATPAGGVSLNEGATANGSVAITTINGFNGTVTLAATGLPSGVTASFNPVSSTTSTIAFSASATAPLTGASKPAAVTVTGSSPGSASQATAINLFVNPAASGGSGTAVDLSSSYNDYAFYLDANQSSITGTNSLDGDGYAFSANLLSAGIDFNGTQFTFGTPNQANAVYGTGSAIPLPAGAFTRLQLLATGIEGNQASQPVTVTYIDNTTSQFTQSFSDWCSALNGGGCTSAGNNVGESVAVAMPYRDSSGGPDNRVFYLYGYSFALNVNKIVKSVTLPNNRDVIVLAATLAGPVSTGFELAGSGPLNLAQGGSQTSTITVTPTGGFDGAVSLSASGLPTGVTAAFNPASTSTTSVLTLTAASSATTGPATITITGTSGSVTQTATVAVTITAPSTYSLSAAPAQATISPGSTSQSTVTVASTNGYTGSVTLSCSISPAVTPAPICSFGSTSPVTVTSSGGTATLTFTTVGPSAALRRPSSATRLTAMWMPMMLLPVSGLALVGAGFGSLGSWRKRLLSFLLLGITVGAVVALPACGGGSKNTGGGGSTRTPAGSYTVTVTGKDAGGAAQSNTAPAVTITVN